MRALGKLYGVGVGPGAPDLLTLRAVRLLESADEYLPGRVWWRLYGLDLTPDVLEKLYRGNARRILPGIAALTPVSGQ